MINGEASQTFMTMSDPSPSEREKRSVYSRSGV